MSFDDVAKAARTKLPQSAFRYPAWWANDPAHHVQARAWAEAGYVAKNVDVEARTVEFVRAEKGGQGVQEMSEGFEHQAKKVEVHPAYGALKGTFTVEPGWDLTKPALDEDELAAWEASLDRKADLIEQGLRRKK